MKKLKKSSLTSSATQIGNPNPARRISLIQIKLAMTPTMMKAIQEVARKIIRT